ncbi:hypothetical protein [Gilvibacter sediminis]|uniref:hypothetical protein n=1 Tax=Gilvibacter sediminis TaxID=379071 RepID=UPI0023508B47|nr:hypothetical protein [Gilvibacter sediminis]MDC7996996.1 hypothetical protein [Gilvibacter sediminis]
MRKDIEIPEVTRVHIVAVREWDKEFLAQNWYVHLINDWDQVLQTTLVMSRGNDSDRKTSTLRHGLNDVAPGTSAKIELLPDEVLGFTNEYLLTFFADGKLYDKTFVFEPYSVKEELAQELPVMEESGVMAK